VATPISGRRPSHSRELGIARPPAAALLSAVAGAGLAALVGGLFGSVPVTGAALTTFLAILAAAAATSTRFRGLAFTIGVFAFAAAAGFFPALFISWFGYELRNLIVPLIQVIMFGMGTTLEFDDFARVARMPKAVLIGIALQFTIMPLLGWSWAAAFGLTSAVAAGLILVGSCPGGVSSNVITYIARGNLALSVTMTACSTMMSPLMTPLAMGLLAGQYIPIEAWPMMLSILKMIVGPVIAGLLISRYLPRFTAWSRRWLPSASMLAICIIIAITIALSRDELLLVGAALFAASVCHNAAGFSLGYMGARAFGLNAVDSRTVAIEVGMQNGGMATGLAFNVLRSELAAMASAVFGPWSAVAGSALASHWRRRAEKAAEALAMAPETE
jgi:bile acid:Na+ symporter, BASS family